MPTVEEIADEIIACEGGYVNDPDDPGGATNHGITIHTLRALGEDLDHDGKVTALDVRQLSRDRARVILVEYYFRRPHLDLLPEPLQPTVFDMQVNSGTQAVKLLQKLLCDMGEPLTVDGICGPQTAAAAHRASNAAPDYIVDAYGIARRNYYYSLADRRPASRKYARTRNGRKGGWITRAEKFISPRYRLTDSDHENRCRGWA